MPVLVLLLLLSDTFEKAPHKVGETRESEQMLDRAMALVREGKTLEAEKLAQALVERVKKEAGQSSPRYAQALFSLAVVRLSYRDLKGATDALRLSCAVPPGEDVEARKQTMACLMNLGEVLVHQREYDEAEKVLRANLKERTAFYGTDHPGYAYGCASLAQLLIARGKGDEALRVADEAYRVYLAHRHEETPGAIVLRGFALKLARGEKTRGLEPLAKYDDDVLVEADTQLSVLAEVAPPKVALAMMEEYEALLAARPSLRQRDVRALLDLYNFAYQTEQYEAALRASTRLVAVTTVPAERPLHLDAMLGVALTHSRRGKPADAQKAYEQAIAYADSVGDTSLQCKAHRELGLMLSEQKQTKPARSQLEAAVAACRKGSEPERLGDTLSAYGIFLQHQKQMREAKPLLAESLTLVPKSSDTNLYVRTHLMAAEQNKPCDCSKDMPEAMARTLEAIVAEQAPKGLVEKLSVKLERGKQPTVNVKLARDPTPAEKAELDQLLNHAVLALQRAIRHRG